MRETLGRQVATLSLFLAPLDALNVSAGSVQLRLYMVPAALVIAMALFGGVSARVHSALLNVLAVLTLLVLASLFWTTSSSDTSQAAFGQFFLLLWIWSLLRLSAAGWISATVIARALLAGLALSAGYAVIQVVVYQVAHVNLGVWTTNRNVPWPRPDGLTREPVWAGLNATLGLALSLAPSLASAIRRRFLISLFLVVVALTFSRASFAVAALIIAIAVLFPAGFVTPGQRAGRIAASALLSVGVLVFVAVTTPASVLARFDIGAALQGGAASADQGSLSSRLGVQQLILDNWVNSPILGHGAGAIALATADEVNQSLYAGGGELNTGRGSTNIFFTNLYDLGALGLALTVALWMIAILYGWRMRRVDPTVLMLVVALLVTFQASNGFRLGVAWAVFAVVIASWIHRGRGENVAGDASDENGRLRN